MTSKLNNEYHWFKISKNKDLALTRFQKTESSADLLIKNFGPIAIEKSPESFKKTYDYEKLSKYSYDDIDHNRNQNRNWILTSDGLGTSSEFSKKIKNTDLILYRATYTLNQFSKRQVDGQGQKTKTDSFVLAAGDSFTFGEGVTQGEDYPSQLASLLSEKWSVYNFGVAGDSANDFHLRGLANPGYFEALKEKEGDFIWLYHEVQMQRLIFPTSAYQSAGYIQSKPEYTIEGNELIYHGFFQSSERGFRKFLNLAAQSEITKAFNLEIPSLYSEDNFRLFFTLLNSSINQIESRNKKIKRKIIISYYSQHNFQLFKQIANEFGFDVFDFEQLLFFRDKTRGGDLQTTIPVDGHPTAEAYWLLSRALKFHYF